MTPQIFAQALKDPQKQKNCYDSFLSKYKKKFDSCIAIRFSAKIYEEVDVSIFFYDHLLDFVINDLLNVKPNTSFDVWIYEMSERRIADIQPTVNGKIRDVRRRTRERSVAWDNFVKDKKDIIGKVVSKCFGDDKYNGKRQKIEELLIQFFAADRGADNVFRDDINDIDGWLYTCLRNLSNRKRIEIETEVGLGNPKTDYADDFGLIVDSDEQLSEPPVNDSEGEGEQSFNSLESEMLENEQSNTDNETESDVVDVNSLMESNWAREAFYEYLKILSVNYPQYAKIIYLRKIQGYSTMEVARILKKTVAAIDNKMNEAMAQLVKVALPDIRLRNNKMYQLYGHLVQPNYNRLLLKGFFEEGKDYVELAVERGTQPSKITTDFRNALKELQRISKRLESERREKAEKDDVAFVTKEEELEIKKMIGWVG